MKKVLAIVLSVAMLLSVLSVNVFATEIELFNDPDGETFIGMAGNETSFNPWDFFGVGGFWGRGAANVLNITIDEVKQIAEEGGATFTYVFSGEQFGSDIPSLVFEFSEPQAKALFQVTDLGDGKYEATASFDELVAAWEANGKTIDDIGNLLVQPSYSNFKLYSATITTATTAASKVSINKEEFFDTLVEAVAAAKDGDTIYLLEDMEGAGIGIFAPDVKDFTIDFGGNTYTCVGPAVGSSGTESQAFHLEKSADKTPNVKLQNGTLTATTGSGVYMLIQNYCNLTLTNMNLIGTTDTQYVLSNNFGNTVIDGNTSITATAGNVAFDVCYANGPYAGGVSVTVNTTGTITGDIELGTWNAAGGSNPKPDINDYLKNANLIINNVNLKGEIRNAVTGTYVPDPEVYSSPATLGLFVSNIVDAANVATATVPGPGTYTFEATFDGEGIAYDWIMVKEHLSAGWTLNGTTIPQGTIVKFTGLNINGSDIDLTSDNRTFTVGEQGTLEAAYYNTYIGAGSKPTDGNITSISVTIEILENKKSEEEIKAEYNKKLQSAIDINGGIFDANSDVESYLPEGAYDEDKDGNILVGDVQLPSVNKNNSDRITGCIYLNEKYHALIVNGRFIVYPHVDNGTGFCTACKGAINK